MVGPFEVESALMEHPAVAEVGVIGKPDSLIGQIVKAFVSLKSGVEPTEKLKRELVGFGRKNWGLRWHPKRSSSRRTCPRRAAARSCAVC